MLRQDGRIGRFASTRRALLRSAEKLVAEQDFENVTVKDIVLEANVSALRYHFGDLLGLVAANLAALSLRFALPMQR